MHTGVPALQIGNYILYAWNIVDNLVKGDLTNNKQLVDVERNDCLLFPHNKLISLFWEALISLFADVGQPKRGCSLIHFCMASRLEKESDSRSFRQS